MAEVTVTQPPGSACSVAGAAPFGSREPLTAADLPPLMSVSPSVDVSPYRYPLLQFIVDWNVSDDPAALIVDPPV